MKDSNLKIYLASGDDGQRKVLQANLELLTHQVELSTPSPAVMIRRWQENPPDIAVVGTRFQEDDCFRLLNELSELNVCPAVAVLEHQDIDRSHRLMADQVMGVLVQPVNDRDLRTAIYLARRRFDQSKLMKQRISELKETLGHNDDEPIDDESEEASP